MPAAEFSGVIDRISGQTAVILTPGGDEILMPERLLPEGASEGSIIAFAASLDATEKAGRLKKAEALRDALKNRRKAREDAD